RPDPLAGRVIERLADDLEADPVAKDRDVATRPDRRLVRRQVGIRDRSIDGEPIPTGRDPANDLAADPDRLVAKADRPRIVTPETAQPLARPGRLGRDQGVAPDELDLLV